MQKSSKGNTGWGGHLWSRSYYIGTLGNMSKEVVERYIANQRTTKSNAGRQIAPYRTNKGTFLPRLKSWDSCPSFN
ncbi:transposase [Limosilactobacillus allomucosae]|uniref:transposase n=1 Tax=Limosilactobacillus allomucosae TaxID=3142938 RepID=UPI0035E3DF34